MAQVAIKATFIFDECFFYNNEESQKFEASLVLPTLWRLKKSGKSVHDINAFRTAVNKILGLDHFLVIPAYIGEFNKENLSLPLLPLKKLNILEAQTRICYLANGYISNCCDWDDDESKEIFYDSTLATIIVWRAHDTTYSVEPGCSETKLGTR